VDGDVLPDLEMDPEMFAEFSVSGDEESEMNSSTSVENSKVDCDRNIISSSSKEEDKTSSTLGQGLGSSQGEETVSKRDKSMVVNPSPKDGGKGKKSSAQSKNNPPQGKRKVKVYNLLFSVKKY
jgi:hypothetical protein